MEKIYLIIAYVLSICLLGFATWGHQPSIPVICLFIFGTLGFILLLKRKSRN